MNSSPARTSLRRIPADTTTIQGLSYKVGTNTGGELKPFPFGRTGGGIGFSAGGEVNFGNFADYDLVEGVTLKLWVFPTANITADLIKKGNSYGMRLKRGPGAPIVEALRRLGFRAYQAQRAARLFKRHETQTVRELYEIWEDRTAYYERAGERVTELELLLREDERDLDESVDHAWEAPLPSRDE